MTPNEKAEQLLNKYLILLYGKKPFYKKSDYFKVKKVALILIDELINATQPKSRMFRYDEYCIEYWQEVKEALSKALILPVVVKSLKEKETIHSAIWTSEDDINLPCKC